MAEERRNAADLAPLDALLVSPHVAYEADGQPFVPEADMAAVVPLGLLAIAQYLHDAGLRVRLLHLPSEAQATGLAGRPFALADCLAAHPAAFVAVGCHWYLYGEGALQVAAAYRRVHPGASIYLGGMFAAALAEALLAEAPALDGVVVGEGERATRALAEAARDGTDLRDVPGCVHRGPDGAPVRREPGPLVPIEDLPVVDPSAPPFAGVRWPPFHAANVSRGRCPGTCGYCSGADPRFQPRAATFLPVARIVAQIRALARLGAPEIFLGDIEFVDPPALVALAEAVAAADLGVPLRLETHPSLLADEALCRTLVAAGFRRFSLGAESGSDALLARAGRAGRRAELLAAVRNARAARALPLTAWIVGLPGESRAEHEESLTAMEEVVAAGGQVYWVDALALFPGTPFAEDPARYGLVPLLRTPADWRRWTRLAKQPVTPEALRADPRAYLTHDDRAIPPDELVERLLRQRALALRLVPAMRQNARRALGDHPLLLAIELMGLAWFAHTGHRILSF